MAPPLPGIDHPAAIELETISRIPDQNQESEIPNGAELGF
jgi:hypothetical protein